jgi:phage terminase large subunit GpA-like protein
MVERGEWRASKPFDGHASFHIWAAYSYSPNATWGQIAQEFVESKNDSETLRVFVNTVLGETWKELGDAPSWERIYNRREPYDLGTLPDGVMVLTAGVDVQKDRWVYEVVGWGAGKQSWSIDSGVIAGDTANEADWIHLDELLNRTYATKAGTSMPVHMLAVDSGFNTQMVYNWTRRHPMSRVLAVKGASTTTRTILGTPTPVDVTIRGQRIARGARVWPIGTDMAKAELYGWLRLPVPEEGQPYPDGFCHFPSYDKEFFKQLTAEHLVSTVDRRGFKKYEWQQIGGRENHFLDARVYARAAASAAGLDRMPSIHKPAPPPQSGAAPAQLARPDSRPQIPDSTPRRNSVRQGGWLNKRR